VWGHPQATSRYAVTLKRYMRVSRKPENSMQTAMQCFF
jgi:hypothetical protein